MRLVAAYFKAHSGYFLAWLFGFIFVLQGMNLHSYVVRIVDQQSLIAVNDDDGSWNIRKTLITRWWKDNGWANYGPFYFRLNHSIQYYWQRTADPTFPVDTTANWEKTAHHAILTTSLLSILALALVIASAVVTPWWQRFLVGMGFVSVLTGLPTWTTYILRAHPDHMLALVMGAAFLLTVRMFHAPADRFWFYTSAMLWGLSMSVKTVLTLCVPGFIVLFVPPFTKEGFRRGLKYLWIMFLAYFAIGFPQTIVVDRLIRVYFKFSALNIPATAESVANWLKVIGGQMGPLLLLIGLVWLCFDLRRLRLSRSAWIRLGIFVVVPFASLLPKNLLLPTEHYANPFIAIFAVFMILVAAQVPQFFRGKFQLARAVGFLFAVLLIFGSTPKPLQAELEHWLRCKPEAGEALAVVRKLYERGENIWVDPYAPYLTGVPKNRMELTWEKGWSSFESGGWTAVVINRNFSSQFLPETPRELIRNTHPEWPKIREFYLSFESGNPVKTPSGKELNRIYSNVCGLEIWSGRPL